MPEHGATVTALARTVSGLRAERGLKQHELASRAGISTNTLSKIENGITNPGFVGIVGLAEAFDMTLPEFAARFEEVAARGGP